MSDDTMHIAATLASGWYDHIWCDGNGHVLARWKSETSLVEVWLPDGSWHLV